MMFMTLGVSVLYSQQTQQDTTSTKGYEILVRNADNTIIKKENDKYIRYLNGNVKIYHDSTFFFADTAILEDNKLFAFGNIILLQDSLQVFGDTLITNYLLLAI